FSHSHRPTRALHSFPTRRSSDLGAAQSGKAITGITGRDRRGGPQEKVAGRGYVVISVMTVAQIMKAVVQRVSRAEVRVDGLIVGDRKSTRLNSSHVKISYAVFCL